MLILLPILLLIITSLLLALTHLWRPNFRFTWIIAVIVTITTWLLVMITRLRLPVEIQSQPEHTLGISGFRFILRLDGANWCIAVSLATILLSIIITAIGRNYTTGPIYLRWKNWSVSLTITGFGLAAVAAGNLYTLLLAWAAFDLLEIFFRLIYSQKGFSSDRMFFAFGLRIASLLLLTMVGITNRTSGLEHLGLDTVSAQSLNLLLVTTAIRIIAIVIIYPVDTIQGIGSGVSAALCLVAATSSLSPVIHIAAVNRANTTIFVAYGLAALIAFISGLHFVTTKNQVNQRISLITGVSALVYASAFCLQPGASSAWLVALIITGGLRFLYLNQHRYFFPILVLSTIGITTLPFTPAWQAVNVYYPQVVESNINIWWPILVLSQSLIIFGFFRNILSPIQPSENLERWMWIIYGFGFALLPITQWIIFIWGEPGLINGLSKFPSILESWPGIVAIILSLCYLTLFKKRHIATGAIASLSTGSSIFPILFQIYWAIYSSLGRLVLFLDSLFDGDGGLLWTMLFLFLIMALLMQTAVGG